MKILIASALYYPHIKGGGEISTQILAEGLVKQGHSVSVVTIAQENGEEILNGVKIYRLSTSNIYWSFNTNNQSKIKKLLWHTVDAYNIFIKSKFEKILLQEQPDIVHSSTIEDISSYIWKVSKLHGFKVVHTLRSYTSLCPNAIMFKNNENCDGQCISCKLITYPKKILSSYVDGIVGISKFVLNTHIKSGYFKNARKTIIFNPINDIDKNLQISKKKNNELLFGFVGRLEEAKGIEFLLENFPSDKILYIFGNGKESYVNYLKKKFDNKNIVFKGYAKTKDIYTTIDILIVPSLWNEPFGRIVPEANSYEIPVLVSNRGGLPELVINGKNGYVFNPNNTNDFNEKLNLIQELYSSENMIFDSKTFKENYIVQQYVEFYKDVI